MGLAGAELPPSLSQADARALAWEMGVIAPWYLREDQLPIYDLLLREQRPFIECPRRYGKTTSILTFIIEKLLQNPGHVALWCEPDKNQAREIVQPEIEKLFKDAPKHLRPIWNTVDSYYWFPSTGKKGQASKLKLRGVNHDRGDSARGPFADYVIADEYGYWADPDYTVREALAPQLLTTRGPLIKASTPPEDLGHPYYDEKASAVSEGRFIGRVLYDNASLDEEQIRQIIHDCKGIDTPAFKREYLCQPVADPERLVIPEYSRGIALNGDTPFDVEDDYPRPVFYDAYVGADLGFNDNTALLFAYWDFQKAELVIEDEWVAAGKNSKQIVDGARPIEERLWGTKPCTCGVSVKENGMKVCSTHGPQPYGRFCDNEKQQLWDMHTLFGYMMNATRKDEHMAAVNALRIRFAQSKIKIKKRCKSLRFQLKVGLWNDRKTDFKRTEKAGHLDAIAALVYLSRNVNERHNPWPQTSDVSVYTHLITNPPSSISRDAEALKKLF